MTSCDLNLKATELCLGLPGAVGKVETMLENTAPPPNPKVTGKRGFSETVDLKLNLHSNNLVDAGAVDDHHQHNPNNNINAQKNPSDAPINDPAKPPAKAQVVGWPPVRSYRKNVMAVVQKSSRGDEENNNGKSSTVGAFVKVCMDGAPYLRKVDLNMYTSYHQLSLSLANKFSSFTMGNIGEQGMIDFMNERKLMDVLNSSEYVPTYEDKDGDWMLVGDVPWEMFVNSCKRLRIMKGSEAIGLEMMMKKK